MSDQDKREAQQHLGRAKTQSRHAARNVAKAAQLGAEHAVEEGKEHLIHAANVVEDGAERALHVAEDGAEVIVDKTRQILPGIFSTEGVVMFAQETGLGFLGLSISVAAGSWAVHKFGNAGRILTGGRS